MRAGWCELGAKLVPGDTFGRVLVEEKRLGEGVNIRLLLTFRHSLPPLYFQRTWLSTLHEFAKPKEHFFLCGYDPIPPQPHIAYVKAAM